MSVRATVAGLGLAALVGGVGWLWLSAEHARSRAADLAQLVESMRTTARHQNDRYRKLEEESVHAMQTIIQVDRAAFDQLDARFERLQRAAAAGGSGVPTIPGVDGSLAACHQRLAEIGRGVDDVDRAAEGVRAEARRCAGDAITLSTCQADLRRCQALR